MDPNYMSRLIEWEKEIEEEGVAFLTTVENMEQRLKMMSIQLEKLKILQEQYVVASQEQLRRKSSVLVNQPSNQYVPESMFFMDRTPSTDAAHKSASYDTSHMHVNSTCHISHVDPSAHISLFDSDSKIMTMQNMGFTSSTPCSRTNMVQMKPLPLTSELFVNELPSHNISFLDGIQSKLTQNRKRSEPSLGVLATSNAVKIPETQKKDDLYDVKETTKNNAADNFTVSEKRAIEERVYNTVNINSVKIDGTETECRQEEQQQNNAVSVIVSKAAEQDSGDGSYYSPPRREIELENSTPIKKIVIIGDKRKELDVSEPCEEMTDNTAGKPEWDVPISDHPITSDVADNIEGEKLVSLKSNEQETEGVSAHDSAKIAEERTEGSTATNIGMQIPRNNTKKDLQSHKGSLTASDPIKEQSKIVEKDKNVSGDCKVSRNVSSKSLGSSTATDSDDSFFDGNLPLTSSAAYKSMIGAGDASTKVSKVIEESASDSDSEDDVERALAMAVNKNKPKPSNESALIKSPVKNSLTSSLTSSANKSKQDDVSGKKNKTSSTQSKPQSTRPSISAASSSKIKFSKATRQALGLDSESDNSPQPTKKSQKDESDDEFDFYD